MACCSICFNVYCKDDDIVTLECHHCYHEKCLLQWKKVRAHCPICSKTISSKSIKKIFLNFNWEPKSNTEYSNSEDLKRKDSLNDESEAPNLAPFRRIKAQASEIKALEKKLSEYKLDITKMRQEAQENVKKLSTLQHDYDNMIQKNNVLIQEINEINEKSYSYYNNFLKFRRTYSNVVKQVMENMATLRRNLNEFIFDLPNGYHNYTNPSLRSILATVALLISMTKTVLQNSQVQDFGEDIVQNNNNIDKLTEIGIIQQT